MIHMMKSLVGFVAATALVATAAQAADMLTKAPPLVAPAPAAAASWTGFYVGGNAGYGWQDPAVSFTPNDLLTTSITCGHLGGGTTCPPPAPFAINGALGGAQAGYNWQINRNWVAGIETDFDWSGIKGTGASNFVLGINGDTSPAEFVAEQRIRWFGTLRARLGYLPTSNLLLYGTGGLAYGRIHENVALNSPTAGFVDASAAFACTFGPGPGAFNCFTGNSSRTATGYAVGGGGEYKLSQNLSVKAEYLYVNLGHGNTVDVVAQVPTGGLPPASFTAACSRVDFNVIRGGLNWTFN